MFMGFGDFRWFTGVVEDRFDPLEQGRLRVRVFGLHTDQKSKDDFHGIPTEELLWLHPMMPINSASMSGIGNSPTGAVEGTHVVGFFRDALCQDGIIMGTVGGTYKERPNHDKGFSDPNAVYPRYTGNDVNVLARSTNASDTDVNTTEVKKPSGEIVKEPAVIVQQNESITQAVAPNESPIDEIPVDDDPDFTIEKMLVGDEGKKLLMYLDHLGYPTIGIGHLITRTAYAKGSNYANDPALNALLSKQVGRVITNGRITDAECSKLFAEDLQKVRIGISKNSTVNNVYQDLNASRRMAIENMCFQMGVGGVAKFKKTLGFMKAKEWKSAYDGLMSSLWAKQTKGRASRVSKIVQTGNLESYGVMTKKETFMRNEVDPDDPFVPPDTRIMFVEPKSSYSAKYPYNQVFESEAGHIQEFDSTPDSERYHLKHPAGTFTEIHPSGDKVNKIFGDNYTIVINDNNIEIGGDMNVVVSSNAKTYIMGSSELFVDGNIKMTCRGNMTVNVEGNMNSTVKGTMTTDVKGDVTLNAKSNVMMNVDGNVTETIKGSVVQSIDGNVNQTIKGGVGSDVTGDYNIKANSFNVVTSADATIFAGGNTHLKGSNAVMEANGVAQISGSTITLN
ncbi:MAG: glycoside hydrolase family protein [Culicoidibacterales bacterium]